MTSSCAICAGSDRSVLAPFSDWLERTANFTDARRKYASIIQASPGLRPDQFVRCNSCGFIVVNPLPDESALTCFYQHNESTVLYSKKERTKLRRATRRLNRLKKIMPVGTFIDIGCNIGFTVEAARRLGYDATGLELDVETVKQAQAHFQQAEFMAGTAMDMAITGRRFDIVYCTDVLEHVIDVQYFAKTLAQLTRPGGILFLSTPDAGHWRVPRDFLAWNEVKPPQHLCWFTRQSLTRLLEDAGFSIRSFAFNLKPGLKVTATRQ